MYVLTDRGKKAYLDGFPRQPRPGARPVPREVDQADMKILRALLNGQMSLRQIQDSCDFPVDQKLNIMCSKGYVERRGGLFNDG